MCKKTIYLGIAVLLVFGFFVSPVAAVWEAQDGCVSAGGSWDGINSTTGTCTYEHNHPISESNCSPGYNFVETYVNNSWVNRQCVAKALEIIEFEALPSVEMNAWSGHCGVNVFSPPTAGQVDIYNVNKINGQLVPNYGALCAVEFITSEGQTLDRWGSITNMFFNLDYITVEYFEQGILNFYYLKDGEWAICENMQYLPNEGSTGFGRVFCRSTGPTIFGLGTDLIKTIPKSPPT